MNVSFRLTVTTLVMIILVSLALLLIGLQYRILSIAVETSASDGMKSLSDRVSSQLDTRLDSSTRLITVVSAIPEIADQDRPEANDRVIELFRTILDQVQGYDSIYVGYNDGHWLQLLRARGLTESQKLELEVPEGTVYILNQVVPGKPGRFPLSRRFLDDRMEAMGEILIPRYGFDARSRPWYTAAYEMEDAHISPPYLAFSSGAQMITVSAALEGTAKGVAGIDIRMDRFSQFVAQLATKPSTFTLVYTADGTLLAHPQYNELLEDRVSSSGVEAVLPTISDIDDDLVSKALTAKNTLGTSSGEIADDADDNWLFQIGDLDIKDLPGAKIITLTLESDFAQDIRSLQWRGLLIACGIGALFLPISWLVSGSVSRQLIAITEQANRLRMMQKPPVRPIYSMIRDIDNLSQAVNLAQGAIWSFSRFVPKELVRRLLNEELSSEIGGQRREITVVFTDVENFTTIAESADPNVLMAQTSRYFSALTRAFLSEGGTIDKFIGDAVMVFWNAPELQPDHVDCACRAVLAARAASEAVNDEFEKEGLSRFRTRFGIDTGVAVVGNLGSEERMNYTALGNTVNLAARLEGLNKNYGTDILVSADVHDRANATFTFRKVDTTIAKGMTHETTVYELVE